MFLNSDYRERIVRRCGNRITQFWQKEFPLWELTPRFKADRVGSGSCHVRDTAPAPSPAAHLGQAQSTVDFRQVMDSGAIMICSLARGALGDQASRLLGAVLIAKFRVPPTAALISHERSGVFPAVYRRVPRAH